MYWHFESCLRWRLAIKNEEAKEKISHLYFYLKDWCEFINHPPRGYDGYDGTTPIITGCLLSLVAIIGIFIFCHEPVVFGLMLILSLVIIWAVVGEILKRHKQEVKRHWLIYQRLRKMENQIIHEYSVINHGKKSIMRILSGDKQLSYYQIPFITERYQELLREKLSEGDKRIDFVSLEFIPNNEQTICEALTNNSGNNPKSEMREMLASIRKDMWSNK